MLRVKTFQGFSLLFIWLQLPGMINRDDDVLTSAEAAAFLRVTVRTVTEEARRGRLPGRRVGKGWRFSRRVLQQWLASGPDTTDMQRYRWKIKPSEQRPGPPQE